MGIITAREGKRRYIIELEHHLQRRKPETELPVENLHAIFFEGTGETRQNLEANLSMPESSEVVVEPGLFHTKDRKFAHIVKRAKKNGTELWFGDVDPTIQEALASVLVIAGTYAATGAAGSLATGLITRRQALKVLGGMGAMATLALLPPARLITKGNANDRKISRLIARGEGEITPIAYVRNRIVAHKIKALAEKTGHTRIGLLFGSGHENLSNLLERPQPLTAEERREIAKRGPDALKMFRCIYDRRVGQWKVEEHTL